MFHLNQTFGLADNSFEKCTFKAKLKKKNRWSSGFFKKEEDEGLFIYYYYYFFQDGRLVFQIKQATNSSVWNTADLF